MRICACIVGLGIILGEAADASYALPPPGPIGWETRIAPGFDPPIEYVLVFHSPGPGQDKAFDEAVGAWGPEAAPVLIRLYRDPAWQVHRRAILDLLRRLDTPAVTSFLVEEAKAVLAAPPTGNRHDVSVQSLLGMLAKPDAATADGIASSVLSDAASPHYESAIAYFITRAGQENGANCRAKLEEIAAKTDNERLRERILRSLKTQDAQARAHEPMGVVLDREAKGEKQ
jgi:hypothetical protein